MDGDKKIARVRTAKPGVPRWLMTFADLMALLFALFVLMLSFSEIDSDKFRKNAGPISAAFTGTAQIIPDTSVAIPLPPSEAEQPIEELIREWKDQILDHLRTSMPREIASKEIILVEKEYEVIIRFPDATAFPSGSAELKDRVLAILDRIGEVMADASGQILVSGHTDDVPISTAAFRSNWDLSTARAVSVIHYLLDAGRLDSGRVTAQGFADSRPLAANDSPENRAVNRRVEIAIQMPFDEFEALRR